MTNDEFQSLVLQHFQKVYEKLDSIDKRQTKLETKIETDIAEKIHVLFEANQVQEERHNLVMERLNNMDERLNGIEIDTGYLVARVARLEKLAK